ncbi:MAG: tetratricopeptide repeat protein [Saprospiraceae bacterium]|nr:tetratricopeptide repeat protein [Saprospiraceae bacterium]
MKGLLFPFIFLLFSSSVLAQESKLAQQYFLNGEFEKAGALYQKLAQETPSNGYYFDKYIDCLAELEDFNTAENEIKKQLKKNPKQIQLYVTYGSLFEAQGNLDEAERQYELAIKKMPADRYTIVRLANAFRSNTQYDLAVRSYEQGAKLLKDNQVFSYNLGDLYRQKGESDKMISHYLNSLEGNPSRIRSLKTLFQRYLYEQDYDELQAQLYERIQTAKNNVAFIELLSWSFVQQKDYASALRQEKALDKRLKENGLRPYQLASLAVEDGDYATGISGFDYVIQEQGPQSSFYLPSKRELLRTKRIQLTEGYDYSPADLEVLEQEYEVFLTEFGYGKQTATIVKEYADLQAFFLNDLESAIQLLNDLIAFPGLEAKERAEAKLSLGDFYLMLGDIWESTLLYSQVDKEFDEELLGHEARFRNARLSFFSADFQWAQAQFDVLKSSTSKLIANDALDLSVFILDNLGLDTSEMALSQYADAELLIFQNRLPEALEKLDELKAGFPGHSLEDDVLYSKAQIAIKKKEFSKAISLFETIIADYPDEIRADNSLYEMANLYLEQLNDSPKASELFEKLFIEYSGSTFAVLARKKFRSLRGDDI